MTDPTDTPSPCPSDGDLASFFGGQLPAERAHEVALHLAGCQECRSWMAGMHDADGERKKARRRFNVWILVGVTAAVLLVSVLVLVILAGEKLDRLAKEKTSQVRRLGDSLRIVPEHGVAPGGVFPIYRRDDAIRIVRSGPEPVQSLAFLLDPGKGMFRLEIGSGGEVDSPKHRGLFLYLFIDFAEPVAEKDIAEFERSADDFVRRSPPLVVMGSMGSWLLQRNWTHHILPVEWED